MSSVKARAIAVGVCLGIILFAGGYRGASSPGECLSPPAGQEPRKRSGPADGDWKKWLTPPPADQPQPRFVCEQPIQKTGPVWATSPPDYVWEIVNTGEAPLRIRLWA